MKLFAAAAVLALSASAAHGQTLMNARVVASCGTTTPFPPPSAGQQAGVFMDATGKLCDQGGGGGGGGAVTLAAGSVSAGAYTAGSFVVGALLDGSITTLGTEADTAWSSGNGTAIAILKKIAGNTAATLGAGSVSAGAFLSGSVLSGAYADGSIVTIGTQADVAWASGNGTVVAILKKIAGNTSGGGGAVTIAAGADVAEGNITDTAWSGTGNSTVVAALKAAVLAINAGYDATLQATRITPTSNSTPIDCSGTATATAAPAANLGTTSIHGFTIQNESTTLNLSYSLTGTAVVGAAGTFTLLPLGQSPNSYTTPVGFGSNHAVSLISTASDIYTCTAF